jgi:small subunit ribosomal protein S17
MLHIHDPEDASNLGDLVEIKQVRPISKTKNWQLVQILEKAQ